LSTPFLKAQVQQIELFIMWHKGFIYMNAFSCLSEGATGSGAEFSFSF